MISFDCSNCGAKISVKDESGGKRGRCPKCKQVITIPSPPDEYGLMLEDGLAEEARGEHIESATSSVCAGCGARMAEVIVVCPRCGMNRETGMRVGEFLFGEQKKQQADKRRLPLIAGIAGGAVVVLVVIIIIVMARSGGDKNESAATNETERAAEERRPERERGRPPFEEKEKTTRRERPSEREEEEEDRGRFPTDVIMKDYLGTVVHQIPRMRDRARLLEINHSIRSFQAMNGRFPKSLEELKSAGLGPQPPAEGTRYDYDPKTGKVNIVDE